MKVFFIKTVLFISIIFFAQIIIARFVAPSITAIPIGVPIISKLDKYLYNNYQVLYLGDSVIKTTSSGDTDASSIVTMLSKIHPTLSVGDLSSLAFHLGIFEAMIDYIASSSSKPEAVIVPINLRSFSPIWDMNPGYQFENEIFFLTKNRFVVYFSKPLSVLRLIKANTISIDAYLKTPVYYGQNVVGTVKEFNDQESVKNPKPENIKNAYIVDYMYDLNENHRKLISLRNIINKSEQAGIKIYVYITPINYQEGVVYVGSDFTKQIKANVLLICSELKKKDLPCLDLSSRLSSNYFNRESYPGEHLNQKGRSFVANQVNDFFLKKNE